MGLPAGLLAIVTGFLLGCGVDEAACKVACERPFELTQASASSRAGVWSGFPEPQRGQALAIHVAYEAELRASQDSFTESCVPECRAKATPERVSCWTRAQNVADWKRCQDR